MRAVTGHGSIEERLRALEAFLNFPEVITPIALVGGDGATPPLHALLSASHSDTVTNTVTRGSLIYANSTPAWDELVAPAATGALVHNATDATWATSSTNGEVLRRSGGVIGFGPVDLDAGTGVSVAGTLGVAQGGTNLASGTSGGILGFTASNVLASSVALTDNVLVLGGGAGATPTPLAAGLGTTTTLLHGNAAGEPTWGAVSLTADVTGTLPVANGGTGVTALSSIDHGSLGGLTAPGNDDHTHYALLAGRTGTTNNLTLSTSTDGTLTGATTTGSDLKLVSDGHATGGVTAASGPLTVGYVEPQQPLHLVTGGYTIDNDKLGFIPALTAAESRALGLMAVGGGTITLSGAYPAFRVLTCDGTVALTETSGNALGMGLLFNHAFTYTNADGLNLGPTQTLVDQPTFSVTTTASARTQDFHAAVFTNPTLSRAAGANTATLTSLYGLLAQGTVGSGCAVTSRYGVYIRQLTNSGTLTNQYGLYIDSLTSGTTNYSYRCGTSPSWFGGGDSVSLSSGSTTADGYAGALYLDPAYTGVPGGGAETVTRHNYIDVQNVATTNATVTDSCVFRFDAAAGTHLATTATGGTNTVSTAGNVAPGAANVTIQGWFKINVNGTVRYVPFFG